MRTLGSMCSGAGMLDTAADDVLGPLRRAWHAESDPAASRVLAHHWPDVANLGDITTTDWSNVEPVDVLTAGFPCQDISLAGRQAGLSGARSGVWARIADAIAVLAPSVVIIENVEGLHSAKAFSDVERCPWCVGDRGDQPALRASGAVLGNLASLGYDTEWSTVPASAVGACHRRKRVFVYAWRVGSAADPTRQRHRHPGAARVARVPTTPVRDHPQLAGQLALIDDHVALTERVVDTLLPTPTSRCAGRGVGDPARVDRDGGPMLDEAVRHLLPTPRAADGDKGGPNMRGAAGDLMLPSAVQPARFGVYAPAIARWERVVGRPAPAPTEPGRDGQPRLSPRFAEWMLGWSDGHVTNVPGVSRNDQLRIIGNGVVPQQAVAAIEHLLDRATQPI